MPQSGFQEERLPSKLNFSVWFKISRYALRYWPLVLASVLCTLLATFYDSSFVPVMNSAAIEASEKISQGLVTTPNIFELPMYITFIFGIEVHTTFAVYVILLSVFILVRSFAIFGSFYALNLVSMHIVIDLRRDTFKKIQELSFSYFDRNSSGWLIARMQGDTSSISDTLAWSFNSILWSAFQIVLALFTMFSIDWKLSLILLASLPLVALIAPIFQRLILKAHRIARNASSIFTGYLSETIEGAKTIKSLALESARLKEAKEITEDLRIKRYKAHAMNAFLSPILSLISGIMVSVIVFYGASQMGEDGTKAAISAATIVLFISFVSQIYDPLQSLAETMTDFMSSQAGAEKVMQLLEAKPEIVDSPEVIEKYGTLFEPKTENYEPFGGKIDFEKVSFSYSSSGQEVIHEMDLSIEKGTSVAIVGETGSGKTTMVNLLCRFYEPTGGAIKVDGVEYRTRSLGWLRSHIGYVQQSPFVFKGSYYDNIAYGKPGASLEEVKEAARTVGIDDFIEEQPNGYYSELNLGGDSLSQGQKQLIAFARALLRDPALLILDEATSSIDTLTEAKLQKAVNALLKGRTSIIIGHRLSTVTGADRILYLDHGKILEDGDHKTLMKKKGHYYDLYMSQFRELDIDSQLEAAAIEAGR